MYLYSNNKYQMNKVKKNKIIPVTVASIVKKDKLSENIKGDNDKKNIEDSSELYKEAKWLTGC